MMLLFFGSLRSGFTCLVSGADTMDLTLVGKEKVGKVGRWRLKRERRDSFMRAGAEAFLII